jgi:hypothetical protein
LKYDLRNNIKPENAYMDDNELIAIFVTTVKTAGAGSNNLTTQYYLC